MINSVLSVSVSNHSRIGGSCEIKIFRHVVEHVRQDLHHITEA